VKLRYRQTVLGVLWVIIQPLLAAGIFSFVFGRVGHFPSNGVPYVLFSYAGLIGWNLFSSTLLKSSNTLVGNSAMITKIFFPRVILPLSTVVGVLIDFAVALVMLVGLYVATGITPTLAILSLPLWVLLMLLFALGFGFLAAPSMASYRDVREVVPVAVQMLLYISPVAYSIDALPPSLRSIYALNPLVGLLEGFRWALIPGSHIYLAHTLYAVAFTVVALIASSITFAKMERGFADVI